MTPIPDTDNYVSFNDLIKGGEGSFPKSMKVEEFRPDSKQHGFRPDSKLGFRPDSEEDKEGITMKFSDMDEMRLDSANAKRVKFMQKGGVPTDMAPSVYSQGWSGPQTTNQSHMGSG